VTRSPGWFGRQGAALKTVIFLIALAFVVGVLLLGWILTGPGATSFAGGTRVALADYQAANPTGVPASLAGAGLVERGDYLAHAADCVICHTAPGGAPFAGGYAFTLPFGTIYSTNITPDKQTGIGDYSDAQFLAAVHRGVRKDGAGLYPAMPYTSFASMTDADALAIKAYLFSLAPVHAPNRKDTLIFPFNQRWLMHIWSALFRPHTGFEPSTGQSPEWNRGAYLSEALAHCGECHTPRDIFFALDNREKFAGAVTAGWRAYNISADKVAGIGAWSNDDLLAYMTTGHALGHGTAAGPMAEAVDESFSRLAPEDVRAIVTYLRSVPPQSSNLPATLAPPAPASPKEGAAENEDGKQLFAGACVSCHGWTGESPLSPFATLTGARAVNDPSAVNVVQAIILGVHRTSPDGIISMPAFGGAYSDTEIAALANYVTARFGSQTSKVSAKEIADLRKQSAQ
jgi:mono/diheme cytochrome c family protein